jgi:hypothetical protein
LDARFAAHEEAVACNHYAEATVDASDHDILYSLAVTAFKNSLLRCCRHELHFRVALPRGSRYRGACLCVAHYQQLTARAEERAFRRQMLQSAQAQEARLAQVLAGIKHLVAHADKRELAGLRLARHGDGGGDGGGDDDSDGDGDGDGGARKRAAGKSGAPVASAAVARPENKEGEERGLPGP